MASWSKAGAEQDLSEVTTSTIRMLDEDGQKGLLFAAIRGKSLPVDFVTLLSSWIISNITHLTHHITSL